MFQCKFSQFLNLKKNEFLNLCATQVVRVENGKCYNFVIYLSISKKKKKKKKKKLSSYLINWQVYMHFSM